MNTNVAGESLPVKVRIYALRDDARFRSAPFADLWTKDHDVLGDDRLQDPKVVVVAPTGLQTDPQVVELSELPKEARFLGVIALIQHADQPDRRRVLIARNDIGSQVIDILDSSIVLHAKGDPVPGRSQPAAKPAAQTGSASTPARPATAPAAAPAPAASPQPSANTAPTPAANAAPATTAAPAASSTPAGGDHPTRGRAN